MKETKASHSADHRPGDAKAKHALGRRPRKSPLQNPLHHFEVEARNKRSDLNDTSMTSLPAFGDLGLTVKL